MTSVSDQLTRAALAKRQAALTQEFTALVDALVNETNPVTRTRYERTQADILAEIERIEKELQGLDRTGADANRTYLSWREHLHRIDFVGPVSTFDTAVWRPAHAGQRAAVLLVQDSKRMCGDLLLDRLREELKQRIADVRFADFHHYQIGFPRGRSLAPEGLLAELARHLDIDPLPADRAAATDAVAARLCRPLQRSSVLLIDLRIFGKDPERAAEFALFAPWFIREFWPAVARALEDQRARLPRVKAFTAVMLDLPRAAEKLDQALFCPADQFDAGRLLGLRLENWQVEDIESWLLDYSPLADRPPEEVADAAEGMFSDSDDGVPEQVRAELDRTLR